MLFGIMISQVSHWWIYGKTDKLLIKSLVVGIQSRLATVHQVNIGVILKVTTCVVELRCRTLCSSVGASDSTHLRF